MDALDLSSFPLESGVALAALNGVVAHLIFKAYEPNDPYSLIALLGVTPAIPSLVLRSELSTPLALLLSYSIYFASLLSSIAVYRMSSLHPLHKFPGPLPCKLSKLWLVYITSKGKQHLYFQHLHDKYGPIVRVGPNELSIIDTNLIPYILGSDGMPKGKLWEGRRISGKRGAGAKNAKGHLIGARNRALHAESRKGWNKGFTPAAVKGYEPIVIKRASQLVEELKERCSKNTDNRLEVDLSLWLSYCIFDWMGDMVFGGGFELMHEGDKDGNYRTMVSGLHLPSLTQHIPWCARALPYLPFIGKNMKALGQFAFKQITKRIQEGSVTNDLFYHLLDENPEDGKPTPFPVIMTNAVTAMLAGSDTTAVALCNVFYCILSNPQCLESLREEVDREFPRAKTEPIDAAKLANMPYLNAVINETLRVLPSIPTSLQRAPEPGTKGHWIGSKWYISEETAIFVPPYALQRSARHFAPDPDAFRPERWLSAAKSKEGEDFVFNSNAWIPFSNGPANCVGKPVALLALRMILAYMVQAFELRFAEGYDQREWEEGLQDYFAFRKGEMPVVLTPRS